MGAPVSNNFPRSGATSADYQVVVDASEAVLDDARGLVSAESIVKDEKTVNDLETDRHRMRCSDDTSQYTNVENLYLAPGTDEIALIDAMRESYLAAGWTRTPSVAEQAGTEQDPTGAYVQTLRNRDGYGLSLSRGEDRGEDRGDDVDGTHILQFTVYSPCIGNPTDKSDTWGLS